MSEREKSTTVPEGDREKAAALAAKRLGEQREKLPEKDFQFLEYNVGEPIPLEQIPARPDLGIPVPDKPFPTYPVDREKLAEEFASPVHVADPETGRRLTVLRLNSEPQLRTAEYPGAEEEDRDQQRPLVFLPAWNTSVAGEGPQRNRLEELVSQTGRPIIGIDAPGVAGSDSLTRAQKKALKTGDYGPVAEAQLRILKELGITEMDMVGDSMGAWASAALAAKAEALGIKIHNLVLVDPPGVEEMSSLALMKAEGSEGPMLELYQSSPYNERVRELGGHFKSVPRRLLGLARWGVQGLTRNRKYVGAMAQPSLEPQLEQAMDTNPDLHV